MRHVQARLERWQIGIYFVAILAGALVGLSDPASVTMEVAISPALALMLFATFLQVPMGELRSSARNTRFLSALLVADFVLMPLLAAGLLQFLPVDPMIRLGVLLVLLTPCIDYVVTFTHMGRGDARLLLAATPILLLMQMLLLPLYLRLLLSDSVSDIVHPGPFLHAFLWLIAVPLTFAGATQFWAARSKTGFRAAVVLGVLPVPATTIVLFLVLASVTPRLAEAGVAALRVAPIYVVYAILAPVLGWLVARGFRLKRAAGTAISFSAATRNSLVIMPLAFAVPGGTPLLPAVIVTQTIVELLSELLYVRWIIRLPPKLLA